MFFAHSTPKYRHRASFTHFYLTAVSQRDHHASVQINSQVVLFDQLCSKKAMAGATVNQSYNIKWLELLSSYATG